MSSTWAQATRLLELRALWRAPHCSPDVATPREEKVQEPESVQARKMFNEGCTKARELSSIPHWVQGPRPSDEALAKHPHTFLETAPFSDGRSLDSKVKRERHHTPEMLAVHAFDTRRNRCIPAGWEQTYELPAAFVPEYVDADGVPCLGELAGDERYKWHCP